MIVGVLGFRFDHYSYVRNIIGKVPGVEYCKTKDLYARKNALAHLVNRWVKREVLQTFDINHQFNDFGLNKVDLLHLYNGISYGRTPWVSTFETILPRFTKVVEATHGADPEFISDQKILKGMKALAGSPCKRLIAMSECSATMQRALLAGFDRFGEKIVSKLIVMHPSQELLLSNFKDKSLDLNGRINFMFVGNAFFRKGGLEIIETFKGLREQFNYDIGLIIVSDMRLDGYAASATQEDVQTASDFIGENRAWISYYKHLSNADTLEMMKRVHVGLLPTYADSYGYSVLEFQACGCPVITTNVRALPEINDNEKGWLIEVPKNRLGEAIYTTKPDRMAISSAIRKGLENAVQQIFTDRSAIQSKAEKSLLSVKLHHSRENFAAQMTNIYRDALD